MIKSLILGFFFGLLAVTTCLAANNNGPQVTHLLPVSQGISSPTFHTGIVYHSGLASQNPAGLLYQKGVYVSAFQDTGGSGGSDAKGQGASLTGSNETVGFGAAYYERDCSSCDGDFYIGSAGRLGESFKIGAKFVDDYITAGIIYNPKKGKIHFGLVYEADDSGSNQHTSYGAGFAIIEDNYTFSVDASKIEYKGLSASRNKLIKITPGIMIRFTSMQVSANYEDYLNDDVNTQKGSFWYGVGMFILKDSYVSYRSDFVNEHNFVMTYAF